MPEDGIDDTPTNLALPKTDATLTVRVIKSFAFRTERSLVLHHVDLEKTSVGQLKDMVKQGMSPLHLSPSTPPREPYSVRTSYTDPARLETLSERRPW